MRPLADLPPPSLPAPALEGDHHEALHQETLRRGAWGGTRGLAIHDGIALGYLLIMAVLTGLSPSGVVRSASLARLGVSATVLVSALALRRFAVVPRAWGRHLYRAALVWVVAASYLMLRDQLPLLRSDHVDASLVAIDQAVFGVVPAVWLQRFNTLPIVEWFSFFYFSYFFICAGYIAAMLWLVRPGRHTSTFAIGSLLVLFIGQLGYVAVPGFGPYQHLAESFEAPIQGGFWWGCVWSTVQAGGAMKDIFPSLHTALPTWFALFALHQARRDARWRWPAAITGFFAANIIVSTMFLRWHYAIDVVAGLALAGSAAWLAPRLAAHQARWCERDDESNRAPASPSCPWS
jgi:membrane-associated phospholipid phosphatase